MNVLHTEAVTPRIRQIMNRVSDLLYELARQTAGEEERLSHET